MNPEDYEITRGRFLRRLRKKLEENGLGLYGVKSVDFWYYRGYVAGQMNFSTTPEPPPPFKEFYEMGFKDGGGDRIIE